MHTGLSPLTPVLNPIIPNPTIEGEVEITCNELGYFTGYKLWRKILPFAFPLVTFRKENSLFPSKIKNGRGDFWRGDLQKMEEVIINRPERRRFARINCSLPVKFIAKSGIGETDSDSREYDCWARNISLGGIYIKTTNLERGFLAYLNQSRCKIELKSR